MVTLSKTRNFPKFEHGQVETTLSVFRAILSFLVFVVMYAPASAAWAEITFNNVSNKVGLTEVGSGKTAGAAWRDFNNDGLPDLWLSNHDSKPGLYVNIDGEQFSNKIDSVWTGNPVLDTHGAAWADYDNDGDPDLFELAGGGSGTGSVANHFYINHKQMLTNKAEEIGLAYARGRGRMPLWLDVDRDGLLDVLAVNVHNPNNEAPTSIFRQIDKNRFVNANSIWGFDGAAPSKWSKILDMIGNATKLEFGMPTYFNGIGFAQLANLKIGSDLELMLFNWPTRTFSMTDNGLEEFSSIDFPKAYTAQDAALEDLNGDGITDFFFASGTKNRSGAERIHSNLVGIRLIQGDTNNLVVSFKVAQSITLDVTPYWFDINSIVLGSKQQPIDTLLQELNPEDPSVQGKPLDPIPGAVQIYYSKKDASWHVSKHGRFKKEVAFTLSSKESIGDFEATGIASAAVPNSIVMLSQADGSYETTEYPAASPAHSVAAGDFDNDGDVDLFVVRTDEIKNLTDVVLVNNGKGVFDKRAVNEGYTKGRGDSATTADFNNDGFLDVYVTNGLWPAPFPSVANGNLYENAGNTNNWLKLDLEGTDSNRDAIGALVMLESENGEQLRVQSGGVHASSQNDRILHFGLGSASRVNTLTILWPNGSTQIEKDIGVNQTLKIIEKKGN